MSTKVKELQKELGETRLSLESATQKYMSDLEQKKAKLSFQTDKVEIGEDMVI